MILKLNSLIYNINYSPFKPSNINKKINLKDTPNDCVLKEKEEHKYSKEEISPILSEKILDEEIFFPFNKFENKDIKNNEINNEEDEYLTEMFGKRGWICILCNNFNYETRKKCNRCGELKKPKKINNNKMKLKIEKNEQNNQSDDWICANCKNLNYSFRNICNRCKIPKMYQQINKTILNKNGLIQNFYSSSFISQPFIMFNNMPNVFIRNIAYIINNNVNKHK